MSALKTNSLYSLPILEEAMVISLTFAQKYVTISITTKIVLSPKCGANYSMVIACV